MNAAHVHLAVNHFPLFAVLFGAALLAAGFYTKQESLSKAGLVLAVLTGIGALVATQSGERAEDLVEDLPGVVESTIEAHEEAGEVAQWASIGLAVVALVALLVPERVARAKRTATAASLFMALLAFGTIARTANLGGQIRHPEILESPTVGPDEEGDDERETSAAAELRLRGDHASVER